MSAEVKVRKGISKVKLACSFWLAWLAPATSLGGRKSNFEVRV